MDTETVTVVRPAGRDPFGDPLPGNAVEVNVGGCLVAPGPSVEVGNGANRVEVDLVIYGPVGMDIVATDRARVRGQLFEVFGQPQVWGSAGVVVALKRTTG
jgi:hypothetical protein